MSDFKKDANIYKIFALSNYDNGVSPEVLKKVLAINEGRENYDVCEGIRQALSIIEQEQISKEDKPMKEQEQIAMICDCNSHEHQIIVEIVGDEESGAFALCHIHLSNYKGFLQRLWTGIKYAFGYKSVNGHWDSFVLEDKHVDQLLTIASCINKKEPCFDFKDHKEISKEINNIVNDSNQGYPDALKPVLATIHKASGSEVLAWKEVVYFDKKWCSYEISKTFENDEKVVSWVYISDL